MFGIPLNHVGDYLIKVLPGQKSQQVGFVVLIRLVVFGFGFSSGLVEDEGSIYSTLYMVHTVECEFIFIH